MTRFFDTGDLKDGEIYLSLARTCEDDPVRKRVPAYYFDICLPGGTKIGYCDLRIWHNELTYLGGNIGYAVEEAYRGHHYAQKACRLLFELAKKHGLTYVIITCVPENIASAKTATGVGGVYLETLPVPEDNEMYREGKRFVDIYRIDL